MTHNLDLIIKDFKKPSRIQLKKPFATGRKTWRVTQMNFLDRLTSFKLLTWRRTMSGI